MQEQAYLSVLAIIFLIYQKPAQKVLPVLYLGGFPCILEASFNKAVKKQEVCEAYI